MPKLDLSTVKSIKNSAGAVRSMKGQGWQWTEEPIRQYYGIGPGKIALHISTEGAILNSSNQVTGLLNLGGAGSMFDATVSGTPIPLNANKTIALEGTSNGVPIMANPADVVNVHFAFVLDTTQTISNMRLFGRNGWEIRFGSMQPDRANFIQLWSNESGTGVTFTPTPRFITPASGLHLFEIAIVGTNATVYLNTVQVSTMSGFPWPAFAIDRLGRGSGSASQTTGSMGDVLGVTLGTGSDKAIAAARAYLKQRFALPY